MLGCTGYHSTPRTCTLLQQPLTLLGADVGDNAPGRGLVCIHKVCIVLQNFYEGLGLA